MLQVTHDSRGIAKSAILLAMTNTREEEAQIKELLLREEIHGAAVDFGGEFNQSVMRIVERAVVAAKREHIISDMHREEGAVAGATREAITQVTSKAFGLPVGGKIGVARWGEHVAVAVFFGVGLTHLNEISVGMGHRTL